MGAHKSYQLLEAQPSSAGEFVSDESRFSIVISAVSDASGFQHVLSRYGDDIWEMWPFFDQSNVPPSSKKINWNVVPVEFRSVCKVIVYRYWMVGLPGARRPGASTLRRAVQNLGVFMRYLKGMGISCLGEVRPLHISNYVHQKKLAGLVPSTLHHHLIAVELLRCFKNEHADRLTFDPWPESSPGEIAGDVGHARERGSRSGKTALIPEEISQALFRYAESILAQADSDFSEDSPRIVRNYKRNSPVVRDACFYLLGVLTGMRCEELVGIELGAGRSEIRDGITYNWVKSIEHKTFKGHVEYLMPALGHKILHVLERWSEPLREKLRQQLVTLENEKSDLNLTERLELIDTGKKDMKRLFLGDGGVMIRAISGMACLGVMSGLAKRANVSWALAPHQMRRLYAWTFVRHRLGNLIFLKEQFKHSSIDMSQLYAANPKQDPALYDEILSELHAQKVDMIESWVLGDQSLAGGAGKKMMKMRANDFPDRKTMIEDVADKLHLRSTGHGWCLAQDEGCGGAGLYEQSRCVDCGNAVIDFTFIPVWNEIYSHQLELLEEIHTLGAGAIERVKRDLSKAKLVLRDLGALDGGSDR